VQEPLHDDGAFGGVLGQELASLLAEIEGDGAGLRQGDRLAAGAVLVDDRRDGAGRVDLQVFRRLLLALGQVELVHGVGHAAFLEHDGSAPPVAGRRRVKVDHGLCFLLRVNMCRES
jgi:hypothetical protein